MEEDVSDINDKKKWKKIREAECLDNTSPDEMEEGVRDLKNDKSEKNDEEKEAEWLDDTSPEDMEEGVYDINDGKNENKYE